MRRGLVTSTDGAAAVEFAIILPVALIMFFGTIAIGLSMWYSSLLNSVATEAARCLAISAPACTSAAPACGDTSGKCFVIALAQNRGFNNLAGSKITIDLNSSAGGIASTDVAISYSYTLLGFPFALNQRASFPNL